MPVKIRTMTPADRPVIVHMLEATPAFLPEEVKVAEELIDAHLDERESSGYHFRVAESEDGVAGFICFGPTPLTRGTWDMYWMATAPDQRGRGIGGALLKTAEEHIRDSGGRIILIETSSNPHYAPARNLYHSHNYEQVSTIPDFYDPGDDKITFRKKL